MASGSGAAALLTRMSGMLEAAGIPCMLMTGAFAQGLADFPSLTEEDIHVVVAFAAASASEDLPAPPPALLEVNVA